MLPFKKILCPTDFSEPSNMAIKAADELATHFSAELYIVHIVSPIPAIASTGATAFNVPEYQKELVASAKMSLKNMVDNRVSKTLKVHPIVAIGIEANEITRIANIEKVDLIVISTHGRTGWRNFIFGSVAEKIIRFSTIPVLTIHSPKAED
jgi:nucleotide-binding universal stress UspA family protein